MLRLLSVEVDEIRAEVGVIFFVGITTSSTTSWFGSTERLGVVDEYLLFGLFILEND